MDTHSTGTRHRWSRVAISAVACSTTMSVLLSGGAVPATPASAEEQGSAASAADFVAQISSAQGRIDELDIVIGDLRESVNRALVDLHDAQAAAEQARRGAEEALRRLNVSQQNVDTARAQLDELTRTQYRSAGTRTSLSNLGSSDAQRDVLERSAFLRQQTSEKEETLTALERARAEAANEESRSRAASQAAQRTADDAAAAEAEARSALESNQAELDEQLAAREAAVEAQESAKQELEQVRPDAAAGSDQPAEQQPPVAKEVDEETIAAVEERIAEVAPDAPTPSSEAVTTAVQTALTMSSTSEEASAAEDSATTEEAITEATPAASSEVTDQAAIIAAASALVGSFQAEHSGFDNPYGSSDSEIIAAFSQGLSSVLAPQDSSASGAESDAGSDAESSLEDEVAEVMPDVPTAEDVSDSVADALPAATDSSRVEAVIARAQSMVGTPYVWGGGDANGPTSGVNGSGQRGFDCSGLVLYAFAGAGISLPHYTGYQYQRGTQIDPSSAQRGDLLFWGANGDSHVAIYLGDGTMIEAPSAGQTVRVTQVRWSGMSPKAVRLL